MAPRPDTWMPLYIGDYLRDTGRLDAEGHGAYLLLIMDYWSNGPLPDDDRQLASIARCTASAWRKLRPTILGFFKAQDGKWHHSRIDAEKDKAANNMLRRSAAGTAAAQKRWRSDANGKANAYQTHATGTTNAPQTDTPSPSPSPDVVNTTSTGADAAPDWTAVAEQACQAAGMNPGRAVNEIPTSIAWAKAGYDPAVILKAIRQVAAKPGYRPPGSLAYFRQPIADAHALKALPALKVADEWGPALKAWRTDQTWLSSWGPRPGEPGCRVPSHLLNEARAA